MASLTVIKGPDRGKRFEFDTDPAPVIGRDARSAIRLHDSEISRHHAEISSTPEGYILRDLDSSNGTFINGEQIQKQVVKTGDRVRVGQTEMIFAGTSVDPEREGDLASKINMISRQQVAESSAIVRAIKQSEGSQYLRHPERAGSEWLQAALANLAVMYETSQAINRISDLDQLLAHLMDLVFRTIKADRGCIVLKDAECGKLKPICVRYASNIDRDEKIVISRTIVDFVLRQNEGVLVLDASRDQRFRGAQSVVQLGIREAICVPLAGRHEVLGVVYIDTKSDHKQALQTSQTTKFTEEHLKLMIAIAHQAGLAIEDSRYYEAMLQAERLAAIGQTIATLSHHIKNILQGVRSGTDVIELGLKDDNLGLVKHGWTVVKKNQERIYHLMLDMLSYSKEREPDLQPTDLNRLVSDVHELMEARARDHGVSLVQRLGDDLPMVAADPEGIHRALLNIVTNALDAVEGVEGARVELETACDPERGVAEITVVDNGVGISAEQLDKIFQIFSSTKGNRGTGLGLAVSRKIAREHGGDIHAFSMVGNGSRFVIELPLRPPPDMDAALDLQTMLRENAEEE